MSHYSKELHMMLKKTLGRAYGLHAEERLGSKGCKLDLIDAELLYQLNQEKMPLKALNGSNAISRQDLQRKVGRLIKLGLIHKLENVEDRRFALLALTDNGLRELAVISEQLNGPLSFAASDLTLNEEKAVLKYLSRLHQGLKQLDESL
jgi:DNA-binding MarR family transcriptional regulator